jgi:IS30 family transposase
MSYQQLTLEERYQIQAMLRAHHSQADIARELGRSPSTISREVRRNRDEHAAFIVDEYKAKAAQRKTQTRRIVKGARSRKIRGRLKRLVEQKLKLSWSPEQICGRLLLERGIKLSHETIYQHVLRDSREQGMLRYCLRFGGYKHHRFKKSKKAERTRQRKNWLESRPKEANERSELGHWERDCIIGARGRSVLLTMVDRRSRYLQIRHVKRLNSDEVAAATIQVVRRHRGVTKSITNDNGVEFQRDESLQRKLNVPIFFTAPASPWERGSVENANGLIRQYLPKRRDFDTLHKTTTLAIEETLNLRPRKILGFQTPHEVFFDERLRLLSRELMRFGLEFNFPT